MRFRRIAAMIAAVVTTALAVATPASAASRVTWEHHYRAGTGCLDASEKGVRGFGCNDLPYQRWQVKPWGDGYFELVNQHTRHCLDQSHEGMRDVGCNGLPYQKWARTWY